MKISKTRVSIDKEHNVNAIKNMFLMVFLSLQSFCVKLSLVVSIEIHKFDDRLLKARSLRLK